MNISFSDNNSNNKQSLEIDSHNENLTIKEFNVENTTHNSHNKISQKSILDSNKKSNKINSNNVIATSSWIVESIENTNVESVINSLTSNITNSEKITKIFDFMEEKIQDQIKLKLEHVTQNYDKVKVKKKRKSRNIEFEEDNFDGLEMQEKKQKPTLDLGLDESVDKNNSEADTALEKVKKIRHDNTLSIDKSNTSSKVEIDPNKYINVKPKHLHTDIPNDITGGNDVLDDSEDEEEKRNVVSEAFADDDVIEEFRREKEEEVS